ncbi:MAG: DUF5700 domain-containing putative Zn-dependent protease [Gemmatimonadota bacterium]
MMHTLDRTIARPLLGALWLCVASLSAGCGDVGAGDSPGDPDIADGSFADRLEIRLVTDEAEAVLAILDLRAADRTPGGDDWRRLFSSEGYTRLAAREQSMGRPFEDSTFRAFALSDELLERAPALRETLEAWARADLRAAARRAFRYLPAGTEIRAKVYPSIKPATNSFVFEPATDPAIFLYLDPDVSPETFANIVAHELHHIGVAGACADAPADGALGEDAAAAARWMGAFAEGLAVLAAAGGPDVHPHASSEADARAVWDRDFANVERDMRRLERFFLDVANGRLSEAEQRERAFRFFATEEVPQGAFYTVGWLMAATVERAYGREHLVELVCDDRRLLAEYNRAAAERNRTAETPLPLWSDSLLAAVGA